MSRPFWGPGLEPARSRRVIGPSPQQPMEPPEVVVPNPVLKGTGDVAPDLLAERRREQQARRRTELTQARLQQRRWLRCT